MDAERQIAELERIVAAQAEELAAKDRELATRDEQNAKLMTQVAGLMKQVAALEKKLGRPQGGGRNSRNSNRPPSSDTPAERAQRTAQKPKSNLKRGGQPKHPGRHRALVPADQVDEVIDLYPESCEACAHDLPQTPDPEPLRFQRIELPAFEPHTMECRRHTVACPRCRHKTTAAHDAKVIPASPFGPRLMSAVAVLTGLYHLSRRKAAALLSDMMGVKISLGAVSAIEKRVCEAVAEPVQGALERVLEADVKHTDGTSWYQAGVLLSLWTITVKGVATVFKVLANGQRSTLAALFGGKKKGVLIGDRASALLDFWAMDRRQICWAHLIRKFVSFSEQTGRAQSLGRTLLGYAKLAFEYWHRYREREIDRARLITLMAPLRAQMEAEIERGSRLGIKKVSGSCANILKHREALWTFVDEEDVEPTNNKAEQALRGPVMWRKQSYGAQSEGGNRFAERLLTVAHTARAQRKNVLEFVTECCVARLDGTRPPSLFDRAA